MADDGERYDYVLANPPFGRKSALSFTNEEGEQKTDDLTYNRQDFWATTSNKQLNFVQHIRTMLKTTGRAAVVVPDNVLFEGGAGETIRRKLLDTTDLHTILRLPTRRVLRPGRQGQRDLLRQPRSQPRSLDQASLVLRLPHQHPPHAEEEADALRRPGGLHQVLQTAQNRHERTATWDENTAQDGRWRSFAYEEIIARDKTSLDIFWLKDKSLTDLDDLPEPEDLAAEIIENLEAGLASFRRVLDGLGQRPRQERHGLEASDCAAQLPVVGSMRARPTSGT